MGRREQPQQPAAQPEPLFRRARTGASIAQAAAGAAAGRCCRPRTLTLACPACPAPQVSRRGAVVVRAEYLGSATNQIMVLSTFLPLVAGRFGLAPTSTRHTNQSGIKLLAEEKSAGLVSNDPAGACGSAPPG